MKRSRLFRGEVAKISAVREFFRLNPDEELSFKDLEVKFSLGQQYGRNVVNKLRSEGLLETMYIIRAKKGGAA